MDERNMTEWRPIGTADTEALFATSTWVLVAVDDGRVTEAYPLYVGADEFIWVTARGNNLKGKGCCSGYLRDSPTHWMPLPAPPVSASGESGK